MGAKRPAVVLGQAEADHQVRGSGPFGGLCGTVGPVGGFRIERSRVSRVRPIPDHQWRPGGTQQLVGDRVEELRDGRVRCRGRDVRGESPAVPALAVQGRVHAPCGDRLQRDLRGACPGPRRRIDRAVEGGEDRQGGQQGQLASRQRLGEVAGDPQALAGELHRAASTREPAEDSLGASGLLAPRAGEASQVRVLGGDDLLQQARGGG